MTAFLSFTNPLWSYLIGPGFCILVGYFIRGFIDRVAPLDVEVAR